MTWFSRFVNRVSPRRCASPHVSKGGTSKLECTALTYVRAWAAGLCMERVSGRAGAALRRGIAGAECSALTDVRAWAAPRIRSALLKFGFSVLICSLLSRLCRGEYQIDENQIVVSLLVRACFCRMFDGAYDRAERKAVKDRLCDGHAERRA